MPLADRAHLAVPDGAIEQSLGDEPGGLAGALLGGAGSMSSPWFAGRTLVAPVRGPGVDSEAAIPSPPPRALVGHKCGTSTALHGEPRLGWPETEACLVCGQPREDCTILVHLPGALDSVVRPACKRDISLPR